LSAFPVTFDTYATDDSRYFIIHGLVSFGSVDGLHQAWREVASRIGTDEPVYAWFEYGKSAADYAQAEEAFWKALGAEGIALSKRTKALIRRQETKTGPYRPDLSYAPKR
jgi:hypothetical protein